PRAGGAQRPAALDPHGQLRAARSARARELAGLRAQRALAPRSRAAHRGGQRAQLRVPGRTRERGLARGARAAPYRRRIRADRRAVGDEGGAVSERVERFCKTTRWFHWTFALSFLALAGTGAALFAREALALSPERAAQLVRAHEIAAVFFLVAPWLVALSGDTRRWLADMGEVLRFGRADWAWIRSGPRGWLGRTHLHAQGKLNA